MGDGVRRAHYYTLGCKVNYAETASYARALAGLGFVESDPEGALELVLVNSCSVTRQAQKKCRQLIRHVRRTHPGSLIVLVGCYADLAEVDELRGYGADVVVDRARKQALAGLVAQALGRKGAALLGSSGQGDLRPGACAEPQLEDDSTGQEPLVTRGNPCADNYFPAYSTGGRTRAFLKVQDGCSYGCSYCAIPLARGGSVSPSLDTIIEQGQRIERLGVREVVITGVNTGDYGRGQGVTFADLLAALAKQTRIPRYRISSIEPNLLNDRVLGAMQAWACFMPHLHVPLQSGSDRILRAMGRRYTAARYAASIHRGRAYLEDPFIGVDVIVGFPGEGEEEFQATYDLLSTLRPSALHVFPFSAHPQTRAYSLRDQRVPAEVKAQRVARLLALSGELEAEYRARHVGERRPILVESVDDNGVAEGFTDNYLRVRISAPGTQRGEIIEAVVEGEVLS